LKEAGLRLGRRLRTRQDPLPDRLDLEAGQDARSLKGDSARCAGNPPSGLLYGGTRALEVGAEEFPAGEIVEAAHDHRHGQLSFRRGADRRASNLRSGRLALSGEGIEDLPTIVTIRAFRRVVASALAGQTIMPAEMESISKVVRDSYGRGEPNGAEWLGA